MIQNLLNQIVSNLLFTLLWIFCSTLSVFADEITLRADIWCPYNCEPDSEKPGFQVEIAKYAFEKAGHTIQYSLLNWSRAVLETRKGKYHAILGAARGDAPDFVFPQSEVGVSQDCFYVKPENTWEFRDIDSLSTITIGVINDYSYGDLFDEYIKEHKNDHKRIQISSGEDALEKNFSKLIKSRITALIEEQSVMGYFLKKISKPELVRNAGCFEGNNVYIAFSPENPKSQGYANILSQGIQELRESGKLKHILDSYGITNWK